MISKISKLLLQKKLSRSMVANTSASFGATNLLTDLYTAILEHSQYFSVRDIEDIQCAQFRTLLKTARDLPFYRNFDQNTRQIITKTDMRDGVEDGSCVDARLKSFQILQHTSGSTGIPFRFFLDKAMLPMRRAMYRRMLSWAGKTDEDTVVLLMPRQHPGLESENILFTCGGPQDIDDHIEELFRLFEGKKIILQGRASHLRRLAQLLETHKKKFHFKALISYTEQLLPTLREYMEKIFCAPVFDYYASNEVTAIAQECEKHAGLHINCEWLKLEIVDEEGKSLLAGERGDVVITFFANEVMPFIRYKLGDKGWLMKEPCACGRTLPRLVVEGRDEASFLLPNYTIGHVGTLMAPIIANCKNIFQYQVERLGMNDFVIKIVPSPSFDDADQKFILDQFARYLGKEVRSTLVLADKISVSPNKKETNFIDKTRSNSSL